MNSRKPTKSLKKFSLQLGINGHDFAFSLKKEGRKEDYNGHGVARKHFTTTAKFIPCVAFQRQILYFINI